ncbi:head-tail adaptor [Klebsiella phage VLCpiS8c]|nr:head-tail adaptor [Klebsiella phage VLCpiS8c]
MIGNLEDLKAFAAANGYAGMTDEELSVSLRQANLWAWSLPWKGEQVEPGQPDIWPRTICDDYNCLDYDTPPEVIRFVYTVVCDAVDSGTEFNTASAGAFKKRVGIDGAIDVEYSEQSLYNAGFEAPYMTGMIGHWLDGSGRGCNIKLERG